MAGRNFAVTFLWAAGRLFVYRDLFRFLDYPSKDPLEFGKTTYRAHRPYSRPATCHPLDNLN